MSCFELRDVRYLKVDSSQYDVGNIPPVRVTFEAKDLVVSVGVGRFARRPERYLLKKSKLIRDPKLAQCMTLASDGLRLSFAGMANGEFIQFANEKLNCGAPPAPAPAFNSRPQPPPSSSSVSRAGDLYQKYQQGQHQNCSGQQSQQKYQQSNRQTQQSYYESQQKNRNQQNQQNHQQSNQQTKQSQQNNRNQQAHQKQSQQGLPYISHSNGQSINGNANGTLRFSSPSPTRTTSTTARPPSSPPASTPEKNGALATDYQLLTSPAPARKRPLSASPPPSSQRTIHDSPVRRKARQDEAEEVDEIIDIEDEEEVTFVKPKDTLLKAANNMLAFISKSAMGAGQKARLADGPVLSTLPVPRSAQKFHPGGKATFSPLSPRHPSSSGSASASGSGSGFGVGSGSSIGFGSGSTTPAPAAARTGAANAYNKKLPFASAPRSTFSSSSTSSSSSPYSSSSSSYSSYPFSSSSSDVRKLKGGMRNLGNSCYMSSVLQALFAIDSLVQDLDSPFWNELLRLQKRAAENERKGNGNGNNGSFETPTEGSKVASKSLSTYLRHSCLQEMLGLSKERRELARENMRAADAKSRSDFSYLDCAINPIRFKNAVDHHTEDDRCVFDAETICVVVVLC
jgi:hypothetical protein